MVDSKDEVASTTESELGLSDEFVSNFKAMYYTLNASPDTQMKVFNREKIIHLEDIKELCTKVEEKLANHDIVISQAKVYISFSDGKNDELSLPEFVRKDWKISSTTKTINIMWDIYVSLPNYEVPQRHSLTVRMGSKIRPDEFFKIMLDDNSDSEIEGLVSDVVCKVSFVNAVLADELIQRVENWYNSLQEDGHNSKLMHFVRVYSDELRDFINVLFSIMSIFVVYGVIKYHLINHDISNILNSGEDMVDLLFWLAISLIFVFVFKYFGSLFASVIYGKTKSFRNNSNLLMTYGDENRRESYRKNNKSLLKSIVFNVLGSFIATIFLSIVGFLLG